ncbi:MAG: secretin N-terminal domain-containing protein [Rubripirellula sp.]
MRRFILTLLSMSVTLTCSSLGNAQNMTPQLQKLSVPAPHAKSIATKLSLQYRDIAGVQISPDARNEQLVVMAPEETQKSIARDVKNLLASHRTVRTDGSLNANLTYITWREFEDDLQSLGGGSLPVTTSQNGEKAAFQLTVAPLQGTTVEVDRRNNQVTVIAPEPSIPGWKKMLASIDQVPSRGGVTELVRLENAEPAPIQRAFRLLRELERNAGKTVDAATVGQNSPFRNAVFQQDAAAPEAGAQQAAPGNEEPAAGDEFGGGAGVIGDTEIQFVPELGTIIIRGAKRDVERVREIIKKIEDESKLTKPDIDVVQLEHADANAVSQLLAQLYEDVLSARQGEVSITSLDSPNALLLIGRTEAINGLKELISKIDQPVAESSRLRVFRLQNASAVDAEQTIRDFFSDRPGTGDDLRPGIGTRVRVLADYRTNSLIVSAAPRDLISVTQLINDLDVQQITAQNQIKIFPLTHASAEELQPVLQAAINGEAEGGSDNLTAPSTTLSIVTVDPANNKVLDSGILAGAVVTADANANAVVVRAPGASMPLIAELIRQLDKAPGIESLVKVFTVQNGDALQLTTALQDLFGADASTNGTSVGAANLPPSTAASDSSLVPLRFTTDQRTNSIVASGSADDLDVVESILMRLDSEGFAERITEVIWLRHQAAVDVAAAIQGYVQQRTTTVNQIQQYQQGLGPYDLPDRDLIVVEEPVSNSLLLSVSPRLYEDVRGLIDKLDRRPPMVLVKVLIAEVALDDTFEIGGEVGLQDSLIYDRGIAAGAFPGATAPSDPGFNFNGAGVTNANSFAQGKLAGSGISSFGVGTTSAVGYGGFVMSAASDSISLLLRTLQDANRLQVLSRPQIMTMDNTEAAVQVGRRVARVTGVQNLGVGQTQLVTEDIEVGLIMNVRPRVGADGLIVMDIDATRSDRDPANGTAIPTGNGTVIVDDILETTAQSVVAAYSGQTVVFGGLIQKTRSNFSRRVPVIADIPLIGHFFKFDQEFERRSELLVILTPMLVTGEEDLDFIKETESSRMSWCLADVVEAHGDVGLSGGYGLWGPAVGNTIYPDLHPTAENVTIHDSYPTETGNVIHDSSHSHGSEMIQSGEVIIDSTTPAPIQSSPLMQDTLPPIAPIPQVMNLPAESVAPSTASVTPNPAANMEYLPVLPKPVTIPVSQQLPSKEEATSSRPIRQSSFQLPSYKKPEYQQSSYTPKAAQTARQASWIDALTREAESNANTPKPRRLGAAADGMLLSE